MPVTVKQISDTHVWLEEDGKVRLFSNLRRAPVTPEEMWLHSKPLVQVVSRKYLVTLEMDGQRRLAEVTDEMQGDDLSSWWDAGTPL